MKIGIVTVQYASNFGAVLQAYSLKSVLEDMGHQVYYIRSSTDKYARGLFYRIRPYGKEYLHLPSFILKNFYGWKRHRAFLPAQKEFYLLDSWTDEALDLVILGSDEIWNVTNPLFCNSIFYGVGMSPVMSYAVSIGNATAKDMEKIPKTYFNSISPILVRDHMTKEYLSSIGIKSQRVCDPTLLADPSIFKSCYHNRLMDRGPYMLVYAYGHMETKEVIDSIQRFAKKNNLRLLSICFPLKWCDGTINCSPLDFSAVMQGATYVFTSTLHGTIFSIINHKQFVSLPYSIKTIDLLDSLHLSERIIQLDDFAEKLLEEKLLHQKIDYNKVENIIHKQREYSKKMLLEGILNRPTV